MKWKCLFFRSRALYLTWMHVDGNIVKKLPPCIIRFRKHINMTLTNNITDTRCTDIKMRHLAMFQYNLEKSLQENLQWIGKKLNYFSNPHMLKYWICNIRISRKCERFCSMLYLPNTSGIPFSISQLFGLMTKSMLANYRCNIKWPVKSKDHNDNILKVYRKFANK